MTLTTPAPFTPVHSCCMLAGSYCGFRANSDILVSGQNKNPTGQIVGFGTDRLNFRFVDLSPYYQLISVEASMFRDSLHNLMKLLGGVS